MSNDAVSDFIFECASKKICDPLDIEKEALRQLQIIDEQLLAADNLRPRRAVLEKVCIHFGGSVPKPNKKKAAAPIIQMNTPFESLDETTKILCKKICEHLAQAGSATNRQLMVSCKVSVEDDRAVYASIKWLAENGIVSKNEATRDIVKGPKWESHP